MTTFAKCLLGAVMVLACLPTAVAEEEKKKFVIVDTVSRAELEARRAQRSEAYQGFEKAKEKSGMKHPSQASLIERSVILSSGSHWTIVPKGAVLMVPERFGNRVGTERKGKLVRFPEFLRLNQSWLSSQEVTMEQAKGHEIFEEERMKAMQRQGRVVVAVRHGGPITVLKPKKKDILTTQN